MNTVRSNRKLNRAFTLIELLVVIAIISILAAILFPVFATAREKARQSSCASNEKQLGIAFTQYTQDYDEMFPPTCGSANTANPCSWGTTGWAFKIYPYVKATGILACPNDPTQVAGPVVSYGANYNLIYPLPTGRATRSGISNPLQISKLAASSLTVLLFEVQGIQTLVTGPSTSDGSVTGDCSMGFWTGTLPAGFGAYATGSPPGENLKTIKSNTAHGMGSNFLATDGHVKFLLPTQISGGDSAASATSAEILGNTSNDSGFATGTGFMDNGDGVSGSAVMTFSAT